MGISGASREAGKERVGREALDPAKETERETHVSKSLGRGDEREGEKKGTERLHAQSGPGMVRAWGKWRIVKDCVARAFSSENQLSDYSQRYKI